MEGNIKLNTLVLLIEENVPPNKWSLGRVVKLFPGKDELVRTDDVRTQHGIFRRAITKICSLPLDSTIQSTLNYLKEGTM